MQIAALNPKYVSRDEISADYIAHEKEILRAQIMNDPKESQKPEKVINGMIEGRVNKELKEIWDRNNGTCQRFPESDDRKRLCLYQRRSV